MTSETDRGYDQPTSFRTRPLSTVDLASRGSYRDSRAIELRECETRERLVIGVFLVSQNADGHRLPQQYRLCGIRAPVQTRNVACLGNIVGEFVQLTSERDLASIRSRVGQEGQTVRSGDHRIGKGDIVRIKECLQHGHAGASHRGMTRPVTRMRWRTLRKGDGQKISYVVFLNYPSQGLRIQDIGMQRIDGGACLGLVA